MAFPGYVRLVRDRQPFRTWSQQSKTNFDAGFLMPNWETDTRLDSRIDQKSCNRFIGLLGARKCARPVRSTSPHDMTELCSIPEWALSFDVSGLKPLLLSQDIDTSSNRDVGDGMTLHH